MVARLMRGLVALLVWFCVGTVIAQAVLAGYLAMKWKINRQKLVQMLAIAQGVDLIAMHDRLRPPREQVSPEQVSYDQVLEARALKTRNLEFREEALKNTLAQLRFEQSKLADEKAALGKVRQTFETNVSAVQKQATDAGWEGNRSTLSSLKSKQAKDLLMAMLAKNEINDVAALLLAMPDNKRAKIIAEFKTPEETEKIDSVLRLIRHGEPASSIAAQAQQQLGRASPTPSETTQGLR